MNEITSQTLDELLTTVLTGVGDSDQHLLTLFSIAMQIKARSILELGVRAGVTTKPLLLATSFFDGKLTSVDLNGSAYNPPDELKKHHQFVQSDALLFLKNCVDTKTTYDMIFIDDNHDYEHVKKELEFVTQMMNGKTVVTLHDLMAEGCEPNYRYGNRPGFADGGPYRAVNELNLNQFEWVTIPVNNGLTILRKRTPSQ
jgi:predicted O-methyltransferase YrrM